MGYGEINPVKRWWSDLEVVAGKIVKPNREPPRPRPRERLFAEGETEDRLYQRRHAAAADFRAPFQADRKAGIEAGTILETPAEARARLKRGGAEPRRITDPTPPMGAEAAKPAEKAPAA